MKFFESKFKVGDKVATINVTKLKIVEFEVTAVIATVTERGQEITLRDKGFNTYNEDKCFSSRDELLERIQGEL